QCLSLERHCRFPLADGDHCRGLPSEARAGRSCLATAYQDKFAPPELNSPKSASVKQAFALFLNQLNAFPDGDFNGVVQPGEAVGANEAVLFQPAVNFLGYNSAGLVLAALLERRRADSEALMLHLLGRGSGSRRIACPATEKSLQERHLLISLRLQWRVLLP